MLSQSSRWLNGGVWEEMGALKIRDCGRAVLCPPTPCWHPRGSYHGAEQWWVQSCLVWQETRMHWVSLREPGPCCLGTSKYQQACAEVGMVPLCRGIREEHHLQPSVDRAGKCCSLSGCQAGCLLSPGVILQITLDISVHRAAKLALAQMVLIRWIYEYLSAVLLYFACYESEKNQHTIALVLFEFSIWFQNCIEES